MSELSPQTSLTAAIDAQLVRALGLLPAARQFTAGVRAAGLTPTRYFGTETIARLIGLRVNHPAAQDALELGPDDTATRADMRLLRDGREVAALHPEKRFFTGESGTATGVAIHTNLLADVYAVIGDPDGKGAYVLRLYHNPLVPWIWLGAVAMALGGLVSLTDRRHRVGAPARRRRRDAAPRVQAAE